jgi:hypothetical protein
LSRNQDETVISENIAEQKELQDQLAQQEQKLAEMKQERLAVDAELKSLAGQREQYELLDSICTSLDRLEELEAADLFWGERLQADDWQAHLAGIRSQSASFCATVEEIEGRLGGVDARIDEQEQLLDVIDYRLEEIEEEEERRKSEWVIEREGQEPPWHRIVMPWTRGCEEDRRFQKSLLSSVTASILFALLLSLIDLPIPDRAELMEVPDRVAKIIELPPAPPPVQPVEQPQDPVEPEPVMADEQPVEDTPEVTEPTQVAEQQEEPKPQVRSKGILAFRESFSDRAKASPSARLGAQARIGNAGDAAVGRPTRAMVTTNAPGSSGGINLASISRDVGGGAGGGQMGGVAVTQVASSIGGNGTSDRPRAGGYSAGRTDEEIQIVFDRYKASLYRLYNRELRRDPTLRGQLVLKLTIEPDGSVSMCMLQATDIKAPQLADQIVARVQGFDFGAKDGIGPMTIIYPIDFLPATT